MISLDSRGISISFFLFSVSISTVYASSASPSFSLPSGYSTVSFNPSSASTYLPNRDYSNEQLAFLWYQVGPISTGPITTTVQPTPEPTYFPKPGALHPTVPAYLSNLSASQLPADFKWGLCGCAFQVEGAAKDEGKGPSIWDFLPHRQPGTVADNTTGDVSAQHYYLYKQDLARLKALGVPYHSFSISWPRIFPFGSGPVNAAGVKHYDDVIMEHVRLGITPVVTVFHWDTPLALFNEYGGWTDERIVEDYVNYAKFIIERYDEYVPVWYTINEPQYCDFQVSNYPAGRYYPAYNNITGGKPATYACGHHTLLAHAKIAKWYHEEFHGKGRISLKSNGANYIPASSSVADAAAVRRSWEFQFGWFGGPWTEDGDYPQSMKDTLGDILPSFTDAEKEMIKGSCDFFAVDPYSSFYVSAPANGIEDCAANSSDPNWPACIEMSATAPDGFPVGPAADHGSASWLWSAPTGVRELLNYITKELYPSIPDIVVSEFGFVEPGEGDLDDINQILWDLRRADYLQSYLDNILAARVEDGVNVTGAFAWAIFDNIEWFAGKRTRFGLQHVNYSDPNLTRTPKASMFQFLDWFGIHARATF